MNSMLYELTLSDVVTQQRIMAAKKLMHQELEDRFVSLGIPRFPFFTDVRASARETYESVVAVAW